MCNEVLGFILMLRTEHKQKIDGDSRIFPSSGFKHFLCRQGGWGGERTQHRLTSRTPESGATRTPPPLLSLAQSNIVAFTPNCLKSPLLKKEV